MKALVVYDSVFGNTEKIARAIADALGSPEEVRMVRSSGISPGEIQGVKLLVIGSPTRGFRPTGSVQALLKNMPGGSVKGVSVAAFDTRISESEVGSGLRLMMKMGGYAAGRIADMLKKKGGNLIASPEGFLVKGQEGPLAEGELERASGWAKGLADSLKPEAQIVQDG